MGLKFTPPDRFFGRRKTTLLRARRWPKSCTCAGFRADFGLDGAFTLSATNHATFTVFDCRNNAAPPDGKGRIKRVSGNMELEK